ncbi:MAG: hypothetical protein WD716_11955 [Fimbriimonadaceae bacterium]
MNGYDFQARYETHHSPPILINHSTDDEWEWITFLDLIELLYVSTMRERLPMPKVRSIAERLHKRTRSRHPLATSQLWLSGVAVYSDVPALGDEDLASCNLAFPFIEEWRETLVFSDKTGEAIEWRPLGASSIIVLDPTRSFGAPIDQGSGITAATLSKAVRVEEDPVVVASWYGTTTDAVLQADEFVGRFVA